MLQAKPQTKTDDFSLLLPDPLLEFSDATDAAPTVVLRSDKLGSGDEDLGRVLLGELFQSLDEYPEPPMAIVLYHRAILLAMPESPVSNQIKHLAQKGTEILLCRTSCDKLAAGATEIAGKQVMLKAIIERIRLAKKVMWF